MKTSRYLQPAVDCTKDPHLILVTGATGFLGKHLVRILLERGSTVRALGRNLKIGLELSAMGADFRPVDLRDRPAVIAACRWADAVVHAGAMSTAWGKSSDFHDINVTGTANVIEGCRSHGVRRLVYISSPSVMSRHEDQIGLDESFPLPDTFVSVYSETKALAETLVRQAGAQGLQTVILRPKAIYGPGDQALFPRLREAVAKGRLPIFSEGKAVTNMTHVLDVVQAILLAIQSDKAVGNTYLITGGEDVNLLDVARTIADRLGYQQPSRRIPVKRAMFVGRVLEGVWEKLHLKGEPPLTRYKVSVLGYSQTYSIQAAKRDLGYEPKITWQKGVEQFQRELEGGDHGAADTECASRDETIPSDPLSVEVAFRSAGIALAPERVFGSGSSWRHVEIPAMFAVIRHPAAGTVLFDTGYSTHFFEATSRFPEKVYGYATPIRISPEEDAAAQVASMGIDPAGVEWIIVSHFDPDHIGGLRDFPNARVICHWRAWESIRGKKGLKALTARVLPGLLPNDLSARLLLLPDFGGPAIGPFDASLDLFGDGSVRLVHLPGHAPGMIGAFVTPAEGSPLFLCADACWSLYAIESGNTKVSIHRMIAADKPEQDETYRKLIRLRREFPEIRIVPSHCPAAAARFLSRSNPWSA